MAKYKKNKGGVQMAGGFKKFIDALNQPIGGSKDGTDKRSVAKREKNLKLKVMELTPQDAIKNQKNIRYKYKVRDKAGNISDGKLDALSKVDVHSFLLNQGYDVLTIEEDQMFNKLGLIQLMNRPMKDKDLNFFLTQLSTYIKAGIPLIDSIGILSKQGKNQKTKKNNFINQPPVLRPTIRYITEIVIVKVAKTEITGGRLPTADVKYVMI